MSTIQRHPRRPFRPICSGPPLSFSAILDLLAEYLPALPRRPRAQPATTETRAVDFTRTPHRVERPPFAALAHRRGSVDVSCRDFPCMAVSERFHDPPAGKRALQLNMKAQNADLVLANAKVAELDAAGDLRPDVHSGSAPAINGKRMTKELRREFRGGFDLASRRRDFLTSPSALDIQSCRTVPQSALDTHARSAAPLKSASEPIPAWRSFAGWFRSPASLEAFKDSFEPVFANDCGQ